jgi:hypothetical protein
MPDTAYTLAEAAAKLGVREDTLTATLPDIGVDLSTRSPQTLTEEELEKLAAGFQEIKTLHSEAG